MKLVASLVLAFLTLIAPAVAQVSPEKLIVPGRSIGPWTLDMTVADLVKAIGPMQAIGPPPDLIQFSTGEHSLGLNDGRVLWGHRWDQVMFRITTKQKDDQRINTMNAFREEGGYKTKEGIGVRSKQEDVEAAFGKPEHVTKANANQEHWIYDKHGIGFRIRPISGLVENIIVFRPGEAKERWKL